MQFPSLSATVNLVIVSALSQIALRRKHDAKVRPRNHKTRLTLLPPQLASLVTHSLQSASLFLKKGFEAGAQGLEVVKHGLISSLEMSREITHDSVARATWDIAIHSDSAQARAYAKAASDGVGTDLHGSFDRFVFWFAVGCDMTSSTAALVCNTAQLFLFGLDQLLGLNNTSGAVASILCMLHREFEEPPMAPSGEAIGSVDMFVAFSSLAYLRAACRRLLAAESRRCRVETTVWDVIVRDACPPAHPREHALLHGQGRQEDACLRKPRCWDFRPTSGYAAELDLNLRATVVDRGYGLGIPPRRSVRLSIFQRLVARSSLALPKRSLSILLRDLLPHSDVEASPRHPQALPDATHSWLPSRHSVPDLRQLSSIRGNPVFGSAFEVTEDIRGAQHTLRQSLLAFRNDDFDSIAPGQKNTDNVDSSLTFKAPEGQYRRLTIPAAVGGCSQLRLGERRTADNVETASEQSTRTTSSSSSSRSSSSCCSSIVQMTPNTPQSPIRTPTSSTALVESHFTKAYDTASNVPKMLDILRQRGELDGMFPDRHFLANAVRYMRFASATYGCAFLRMLGIETAMPARMILDDTHLELRSYAHHTRSEPGSILLCSFVDPQGGSDVSGEVNTGMPLVHYISLDHESKAVVLACRGTLGFEDVLADMACEYDDLTWQDNTYKVHKGVHASAQRLLYGGDGKVLHILEGALKAYPDYGLVLTGHSLGAAVTSLLGIMLAVPNRSADTPFLTSPEPHTEYLKYTKQGLRPPAHDCLPSGRPIHVFAYGPPSTICTQLREATRGLITTMVNGTDLVPFLSLGALHDVQAAALVLKRRCSVSNGGGPDAALSIAFQPDPQTALIPSRQTASEAPALFNLTFGKAVMLHMQRTLANSAARRIRRYSTSRTANSTASTSAGTRTSRSIYTSPRTSPTSSTHASTNSITTTDNNSSESTHIGSTIKSSIYNAIDDDSTSDDDDSDEDDDNDVEDDEDSDEEEAQWAYAALQALRTRMNNEKLVPPGEVFVLETREVKVRRKLRRHTHMGWWDGVCSCRGVAPRFTSHPASRPPSGASPRSPSRSLTRFPSDCGSGLGCKTGSGAVVGLDSPGTGCELAKFRMVGGDAAPGLREEAADQFGGLHNANGRPAAEKRMVLKYVRNVQKRFGELRFGPSVMLDHSPARYEASLESLMAGLGVTE